MVHHLLNTLHNKLYGKLILFAKQAGLVEAPEKDLYHAAILLKDLCIVRKYHPVSLDYMLEELSHSSGSLKPVFQKTLALYRTQGSDAAFRYFSDRLDSKYARNLALLMSKMDKIDPAELVSQIDIFIGIIREVRTTEAMKTAERRAAVCTFLAAAAFFALMIDFLVVVVFMDTLESLRFLY